jgi:hypothetical protein
MDRHDRLRLGWNTGARAQAGWILTIVGPVADPPIGVSRLTQFRGARKETGAVGLAPADAKCLVDDAVYPCPLVP